MPRKADKWWLDPKEKERRRLYMAKYWEKNAEKRRAQFSDWRLKNEDYDKKRCLEWQKKNPAKTAANIAKYHASKLQRTPRWSDLNAIVSFYDEAKRKTEETGIPHEVDHIYPLLGKTVSGLHVPQNLQVLTAKENRSKNNRV